MTETFALFSDLSYPTSTAVYVLAMIFFAVEQAFGKAGRKRAEEQFSRRVALVGAAAPAVATETAPPAPVRSGRPERFGRMGVSLLALGVILHFAALVLRGLAAGRVPWGNMYEFVMALTLFAVLTWLVVLRTYPVRHLSSFVLLPVVILQFIGTAWLYSTAAPVEPALQSYWLAIHVLAAVLSSGIFLVAGVSSVMYLFRSAHERDPVRFARLSGHLPPLDVLDRVSYRTTVFAFPIYTFGVIAGAVWAEEAWSRFWGWDPKETVAFVAWVVYAAYLHSRATAGWRGDRAAAINSLGFACIVFNLFFVNLVTTGLHSYAGVG